MERGIVLEPANEVRPARHSPFFQEYAGFTLTYSSLNLLDRIGRATFDAMVNGPGEEEGSPVKVKFTPRYCKEAHTLLAEKNLAPKLRQFEELKNGWKVVVMDFVAGPNLASVGLTAVPPQALKDIERVIDVMHEPDLVLGDLRRPNIILCKRDAQCDQVGEGVMLVDFDWSGEHGKQRYPTSLNPHVKWAEGIKPKWHIMKKHDLAMLALLKGDLQSTPA
ncbi:hypothetical protein FRC04_007372 [Tulasnella sp. 424]|nr:hypothetical protein FRC04_007372 [Tulasnella sp. 424]KAG8971603.1 hypothetical protein FRC05_010949 [Tulasnella sp. 425]